MWHRRLDVPLLHASYPVAVAALLFLPVIQTLSCFTRVVIRRRRRSTARCPACGYNLRATPERCPECGTPAGGQGAE
jgi:hypothetical protein